jgi:hypothetical protein
MQGNVRKVHSNERGKESNEGRKNTNEWIEGQREVF